MSFWSDAVDVYKDAWNGQNADGDEAKYLADTGHSLPVIGNYFPTGDEAKSTVESLEGPQTEPLAGNTGNHVGTILGGLGGPMMAETGSEIGGWLQDTFTSDD